MTRNNADIADQITPEVLEQTRQAVSWIEHTFARLGPVGRIMAWRYLVQRYEGDIRSAQEAVAVKDAL